MRALAIAILVLLSPLTALAQTAPPAAAGPSLSETVPMPRPEPAPLPFRHVAAIAAGAVVGVIALNIASGGMFMSVLSAGLVEATPAAVPAAGAAVAAAATSGVDYLATATEAAVIAVGAVVGGYVGNKLYER
jgi:hypothetical protein